MADEDILNEVVDKLDQLEKRVKSLESFLKLDIPLLKLRVDMLATAMNSLKSTGKTSLLLSAASPKETPAKTTDAALTERLDEIAQRLAIVELLSGQNYTDIVKLRLAK